ncbi:MAG: chromosome segregation protein SMC, partial [Blautia sp.]|nr:chromosome segregation protein SMC [Blautia sp.]
MYLKTIEVHGFKSFAQKIDFEFHNGITGIVGPNGSGKSNVADAVRWVLGEQSAKQLRGGNMQDVIFSGTELRKPLSFASVAITLDNSDHQLPVDFEEVTVTRRLYRSGESEYLLNGSNCRLKDINEMFYDTGIGKEGYSIIGQGQIDKILSGKPEDRRELFDEAAGIVKFKRRKNMTMKKLEEERQNLVRVTDILSELTHRLGPLERQSEAARIYLTKRDELRELDVNFFLAEDEQTGQKLKELEEKGTLARENLEEKQEAFSQVRVEYDRLEKELEELGQKMEELREQAQRDALRKQELEGQIQVMEEQISSSRQSDTHHQNRLAVIEEEKEKRSQEHAELADEKSALHMQLRDIRKELHEKDAGLKRLQDEILELTQAIEDAKNEVIEIIRERTKTSGQVQRFDAVKEQIGIRNARISQRILQLKSEEKEQASLYEEANAAFEKVTKEIQDKLDQCQRLEGSLAGIAREVKMKSGQLEQEQAAFHKESSRLDTLRGITERYDGYGNSIRRVMEQKGQVSGIHGVVADLIHVQKDYEIAIETALGGSIQNIVTDNEQTAKQLIEYLKQNRFGRATFLPLSSMNSRGSFQPKEALKEPGVIGIASDLVETDPQYRELAGYLLSRVLVVDHIDHAIALGRKYRHSLRMVTIEGESFSPGGSMTGGAFKNNSNLLGRRRE